MNKTIDRKHITKKQDSIDVFLAYLDQNRQHIRTKQRTPFYGGLKRNHKFMLPEANPRVKTITI